MHAQRNAHAPTQARAHPRVRASTHTNTHTRLHMRTHWVAGGARMSRDFFKPFLYSYLHECPLPYSVGILTA